MANPRYVINTNTNSAQLYMYVNDDLLTTYLYDNSITEVTFESLSAFDIDIITFTENVYQIGIWISLINKLLKPEYSIRAEFEENITKKNDKIDAKFYKENDKITDVTYYNNTGICRFKNRSETTVSYSAFIAWQSFLNRFVTESNNY